MASQVIIAWWTYLKDAWSYIVLRIILQAQKLNRVGGKKLTDAIKGILFKITTNDVVDKFNYLGRKGAQPNEDEDKENRKPIFRHLVPLSTIIEGMFN